jgi:hypothetical protein
LGRDAGSDEFADSFQEAFDRPLGRLDEEFARVLAYVESEKIKAVVVADALPQTAASVDQAYLRGPAKALLDLIQTHK